MKRSFLSVFLSLIAAHAGWGELRRGDARFQKATFAAGCFWCIQSSIDQVPGVVKTTVGYAGGAEANPTYEQVSSGQTGHAEAIEVVFDPTRVSYEKLLDVFWQNINPTTQDAQFPDRGRQYRTAIFYRHEGQRLAALASRERLEKSGRFEGPIATQIERAGIFWPAEEHHQKYSIKSPESYRSYTDNSGRKEYFKRIWGK
ncbi:MAG: peptide-methionine (S)-S-oxide reductase [Elusimicrobia bacterium RIFCSPLOWO2_01_FULL_59_12]|nr:MAG: peptide-methionine (S)-S-oxide reductase [Elusimicrobia bacterium RIFCSPLOWO2_01_FULL_59_12]